MAEMEWTEADDRALAMYQIRQLAERTFRIDTTGLSDDEVMHIVRGRVKRVLRTITPFIEKCREAGVIPRG